MAVGDVTMPALRGPVALGAGEAQVAFGTTTEGALAQVSGAAIGFNLFTPTTNCTYSLVIRGQDVATGAPTNAYVDVVILSAVGPGWAPVATPGNTLGAPGARTYSNNAGALKVVHGNGITWYVDVCVVAGFAA